MAGTKTTLNTWGCATKPRAYDAGEESWDVERERHFLALSSWASFGAIPCLLVYLYGL